MCRSSEECDFLLGKSSTAPTKKESDYVSARPTTSMPWRRIMDMAIGFAFCALVALVMHHQQQQQQHQDDHWLSTNDVTSETHHKKHDHKAFLRSPSEDDGYSYSYSTSNEDEDDHDESSSSKAPLLSKYKRFQAMGFQIYTGGAPALVPYDDSTLAGQPVGSHSDMIENPECAGLNSYGHFDDYDAANGTSPSSLWQCYLGHEDQHQDVEHRLQIMTDAVERAHQVASKDEEILKIFIAPEFFFRGREGAYVFDVESNRSSIKTGHHHHKHKKNDDDVNETNEDNTCTEVCQIMLGLEQLVSQRKYKDWLFLFGTVVVSETLPREDEYDYLFYNFAPVYKGYDPEMEDHFGKRFLVPKRYVSNVDFLTPVRQYNGTMTKELMELTQHQLTVAQENGLTDDDFDLAKKRSKKSRKKDASNVPLTVKPSENHQEPVVVENPFVTLRDFYDRDMWYDYKDELESLGYTMLDVDWLILDNITFTIEVCLDHDAQVALSAYLADNVMGSPLRIPKSVANWDSVAGKYVGSVEHVRIPRHQAQISLVSSMGMTANPQSLALVQNGTLILQDGQSDLNGTMAFIMDCDSKSWHFDGGTEFISRTAAITSTRINFAYQIHEPAGQYGIYDNLYDDGDHSWKKALKGVFTTTRYEPRITVYPIRDIAEV